MSHAKLHKMSKITQSKKKQEQKKLSKKYKQNKFGKMAA
jgi:hypothetical protein